MSEKDLFVSLVAPVRNQPAQAAAFLRAASALLKERYHHYEILIVDDGSTDNTVPALRALLAEIPCVRLIQLSRPSGRDAAVQFGLETSIGDFVAIYDIDSDPLEQLPAAIELCRTGSGIVHGTTPGGLPLSGPASFLQNLFQQYGERYLGLRTHPDATRLLVLSRQVVNALTQMRGRHPQIWLSAAALGIRGDTLPCPLKPGSAARGPSVLELLHEWSRFIIAHTKQPLRFVSVIGLFAAGLNLLYVVYVVTIYLSKPDVAPGWTTLSLQQAGMFFCLFVVLSVLCEYVGRLLEENQHARGALLSSSFIAGEQCSSVMLENSSRRNLTPGQDLKP